MSMYSDFYPSTEHLIGGIQQNKLDTRLDDMPSARIDNMNQPEGPTFKTLLSNMAGNLNDQMNAPDQMLKDVMMGSNKVDIHDVMTAMAKAELNVNIATQVKGKVIQAYDKIMQIQL
ncbi:flagellar hook-basal body complex protein FliE [bacterium]|nr:flagellar hook-basal body complex protein FliE [bacterium]